MEKNNQHCVYCLNKHTNINNQQFFRTKYLNTIFIINLECWEINDRYAYIIHICTLEE